METVTEQTSESATATISATVTSGFEQLAVQECIEKLGSNTKPRTVKKFRGRILFDLPYDQIEKATSLRSVDNLSVLIGLIKDVDLSKEKDEVICDLCQKISDSDWKLALDTWKLFTKSDFCLEPLANPINSSTPQTNDESSNEVDAKTVVKRPTFRITCTRTGDKHKFSSRDFAPALGNVVNETFGWPVKMKEYDIEVVANILEESTLVTLSLTRESLHRRNITHFGVTTLKSTIAYSMIRLAQPKPGEIICDPLCGVGAIPLEALQDWKMCHIFAGDVNDVAVERTKGNIDALAEKRRKRNTKRPDLENDVYQWDVTNLPLKSSSVDVFVSDLPFGKRMGNRKNNWSLYHKSLEEMARVCPPGTGRAVLLTQDKKCMVQTLQRCSHLWRKKNFIFINHGGLKACVYLLQRQKVKNKTKRKAKQEEEGRNEGEGEVEEEEEKIDNEIDNDNDGQNVE